MRVCQRAPKTTPLAYLDKRCFITILTST